LILALIHVVVVGVQYEYLCGVFVLNPGFVFVVHQLQVVQRHLLLLVAVTLLDALEAGVRLAF